MIRMIKPTFPVGGQIKEIVPINTTSGVTVVVEGIGRTWNKQAKKYEDGVIMSAVNCFGPAKDIIDGVPIGGFVFFECAVETKEYNGKFYTNLVADKVVAPTYSNAAANRNKYEKEFNSEADDDLPFD